jgi:hypothetical protein
MDIMWFHMMQDCNTIYKWFQQFDVNTIYSIALLDCYDVTFE